MKNLFVTSVNKEDYFIVKYFLQGKTSVADAAFNLAVGQSIGNPKCRAEMETEEMFEKHSCLILGDEIELKKKKEGIVCVAFPESNINFKEDGISHLLVQVMGGQCDIDEVQACHLLDIEFTPKMKNCFLGPKIGLKEIRNHCGIPDNQVIFGGITKPKIGLSAEKHLELVKKLLDGGCNFIKEDEILCSAAYCGFEKRIDLVSNLIRDGGYKTFYCVSLHSDPAFILNKAKLVHDLGGNGIHTNFHCGMGVYKSLRELNLPLLIHFQKSGDRVLNFESHQYRIDSRLLFKLAAMSGCGTLHVGMIGGYLQTDEENMKNIISDMNQLNAVPALSCGMHPGLVDHISSIIGHNNWMANVGGAITSHPNGTTAGAKAMSQSITKKYSNEYYEAIEKWGKI